MNVSLSLSLPLPRLYVKINRAVIVMSNHRGHVYLFRYLHDPLDEADYEKATSFKADGNRSGGGSSSGGLRSASLSSAAAAAAAASSRHVRFATDAVVTP